MNQNILPSELAILFDSNLNVVQRRKLLLSNAIIYEHKLYFISSLKLRS